MREFEKHILDFLEKVKIKYLARTRDRLGVTFEYGIQYEQCETFYILNPSEEFQRRLWERNGNGKKT